MSTFVQDKLATGAARVVAAPDRATAPRHQVEVDQNFDLPGVLFAATVGCYLGFVALMFGVFAAPMLAIPMVIFAGIIVAGFGVPAVWTRLAGNRTQPMSWGAFQGRSIMTNTGRCTARDAAIQMLILPVLIVAWGAAIAIIAALVA